MKSPLWQHTLSILALGVFCILAAGSMDDSSSNKSSSPSDDGAPKVTLTCYGDDAVNNYRAYFYYDGAKDSDHRTLYLENDGGEIGYTKLPVQFTEKTDKSYKFSCSERLECDEVVIHRDTLELHRLASSGLSGRHISFDE
jgi:hypothetical protein